jgi:hypothetical protein
MGSRHAANPSYASTQNESSQGFRINRPAISIGPVRLLTLPALRAINDVKNQGQPWPAHGKQLPLGPQQPGSTSALAANHFGRAHKRLPQQGI